MGWWLANRLLCLRRNRQERLAILVRLSEPILQNPQQCQFRATSTMGSKVSHSNTKHELARNVTSTQDNVGVVRFRARKRGTLQFVGDWNRWQCCLLDNKCRKVGRVQMALCTERNSLQKHFSRRKVSGLRNQVMNKWLRKLTLSF